MQNVPLDSTDRKILDLLQREPGINASGIGERDASSAFASRVSSRIIPLFWIERK